VPQALGRVLTSEGKGLSNTIHPAAIVAEDARLGNDNVIGPYAVVEAQVIMGDGNHLGAHAVLKTGTRLGNRNRIFEHAVLGGDPQDLKFSPETESYLRIGDDNVLREGVTVNRGSKPGSTTVLGNGNFLMTTSHIGHDCQIGDHNVFTVSSGLAGHVTVADRVFVSGGVMIHQFTHIGTLTMLGGNSKITQDCLPYLIVDGHPARVRGLNVVGLKRSGCTRADLAALKDVYRLIFRSGLGLDAILEQLDRHESRYAPELAAAIRYAKRGFHREQD
jgi:UDP-N-acetylglucosamine acyltransferase